MPTAKLREARMGLPSVLTIPLIAVNLLIYIYTQIKRFLSSVVKKKSFV